MSKYHVKYFNSRTHRTDNMTIDNDGSPIDAVACFMRDHPTARKVYQVYEQVPPQRSVKGSMFRVDVGHTARVVYASNAEQAARAVSAQTDRSVRKVWKLVIRNSDNHMVEV